MFDATQKKWTTSDFNNLMIKKSEGLTFEDIFSKVHPRLNLYLQLPPTVFEAFLPTSQQQSPFEKARAQLPPRLPIGLARLQPTLTLFGKGLLHEHNLYRMFTSLIRKYTDMILT